MNRCEEGAEKTTDSRRCETRNGAAGGGLPVVGQEGGAEGGVGQGYQWEMASGLENMLPEQFGGFTDNIRGSLKPWKQARLPYVDKPRSYTSEALKAL